VLTRFVVILSAVLMLEAATAGSPAAASGCGGTRGFAGPNGSFGCAGISAIHNGRPGPVAAAWPVDATTMAMSSSPLITTLAIGHCK
jgi:hypothetical protein